MPGGDKKGGGLVTKSAYKMKYQGNLSAFPFKSSPMRNEDVYKKADALYDAADEAHEKAMKIGDEPHMQVRKQHLIDKSKRLLDENYEEEMRIFRESQSKQ